MRRARLSLLAALMLALCAPAAIAQDKPAAAQVALAPGVFIAAKNAAVFTIFFSAASALLLCRPN